MSSLWVRAAKIRPRKNNETPGCSKKTASTFQLVFVRFKTRGTINKLKKSMISMFVSRMEATCGLTGGQIGLGPKSSSFGLRKQYIISTVLNILNSTPKVSPKVCFSYGLGARRAEESALVNMQLSKNNRPTILKSRPHCLFQTRPRISLCQLSRNLASPY